MFDSAYATITNLISFLVIKYWLYKDKLALFVKCNVTIGVVTLYVRYIR